MGFRVIFVERVAHLLYAFHVTVRRKSGVGMTCHIDATICDWIARGWSFDNRKVEAPENNRKLSVWDGQSPSCEIHRKQFLNIDPKA